MIHIADLHLDSRMETNLERSKAQKRRKELVTAFEKVVTYAQQNAVRVVIIAGDLFDHQKVTQNTVQTVADIMCAAPDVDFLLLPGNHDSNNPFETLETLPENLKFFSDSWTYYEYDNVTIAGICLTDYNTNIISSSLSLLPQRYNIAVMHGDISSDIRLSALRGKNIDYLALGHIHEHSSGELDARGKYAYCGCLESRGFDESGKKGFCLLDTDKNSFEFITGLSIRTMFEIEVNITGLVGYADIRAAVERALEKNGAQECDMVKIIFTGNYTLDTNKDLNQLLTYLQNRFFFARIRDNSTMQISADDYKNDISLKGEFVRSVLSSELSEEEKQQVILYGIRALRGEEMEL